MGKIDYRDFKTPFFEVSIGKSNGSQMTVLPYQVAKLVERVEITETLCCNTATQINITFNEGSREPYSMAPGSAANPDVYSLGGGASSALSNQTGSLLDLRFGGGGLTSLLSGSTAIVGGAAKILSGADALSGLLGKDNSEPAPVLDDKLVAVPFENIHFLFQANNLVRVTWGYKEDPSTIRTVAGAIHMVTADFPQTGTPKVNIVAVDPSGIADQITPKKGKIFGLKVPVGISESAKPMFDYQDLPIAVFIKKICTEAGVNSIVSTNFPASALEAGKSKLWMGGESLHNFFVELAKRHNAVYQMLFDPGTFKSTVVFLSKKDWYNKIILSGSLTKYRGANSILKSVSLKADYGIPQGQLFGGVSDKGGQTAASTESVNLALWGTQQQQNNNPSLANPIDVATGFDGVAGGTTGGVAISAEATDTANQKDVAQSANNNKLDKTVVLEFNALGFTGFTPGMINFQGIGERYSGVYNVMTVSHTLDSGGYSCRGTGKSHANAKGGVDPAEVEGKNEEPDVDINLFKSASIIPPVKPVDNYFGTFVAYNALSGGGSTGIEPDDPDDFSPVIPAEITS